jgi:hypothetical protein
MKNTIKLISVFACMILLLNGCKKDGPVTLDSIPPTLTLTIQGGGETYTLRHTEDYTLGALNLKPNTKYTINCVAADSGGVLLSQLTLPKLLMPQTITGIPNDTIYDTSLNYSYRVNILESDPYKSTLLYGEFVTPTTGNGSSSFSIAAVAKDFRYNRSAISFYTNVESNPVGGYGWVAY